MLIERLNLPLKPEDLDENTQIFGPGENSLELDSVDGLEIIVGLNNVFDVSMTEEEGPEAMQTIGTLSDWIMKKNLDRGRGG
ncbi:MAG: acyl carrier protein [Thermosulfidibacteraceae bacterium]